jgi:hypothetical protein
VKVEDVDSTMVQNEEVAGVLLSDGKWYDIEPGSFGMHRTSGKVPFLRFTLKGQTANGKTVIIETFPNALAGLSYYVDPDEQAGSGTLGATVGAVDD